MKVTRKISHEMPKAVKRPESEELAPSLRLRELPKEIEGLEPGKDFEAHIKGKCISHDHQKGQSSEYGGMMDSNGEDANKDRHHYELEVHHFEHKGEGGMPKKKKTSREEVEDAMDKHDKARADEEEKKKSKKEAPE